MSRERKGRYSLPPRASSRPRNNARMMSPETRISSMSSASTMGESPFQMMDIIVSVDIMEGLVMEFKDKNGTYDSFNPDMTSSQIMGSLPVTTFVSCKKNVSSTRTISTNVPSLPLSKPSSSHGGKHHHFLVRWPADFDPHGDALSTFKLTRLMKKEAVGSKQNVQFGFGYVPEEVELTIGLMRGSEMLTLGLANLVITGEETEEMIIDLPLNITKEAVKDAKNKRRSASPLRKLRSPSKTSLKVLKPTAFPSDPKRKYRLSEQSMIRLQVKITPKSRSAFSSEDSEAGSQYIGNSHYDSVDDYRSNADYNSHYDGSTNRAAPMDELQNDFDLQVRLREEDRGNRRVFKEMPRLTQDYSDYGRTVGNTYELEQTKSYNMRRVAEARGRDYLHDDNSPPFQHNRELYNNSSTQLVPVPSQSEFHHSVSGQRSNSRLRSSSRQRASSRQRSILHDHDHSHHSHHHHRQVDPRRLNDRSGQTKQRHDLKSRNGDQFGHMKPKVRDENRQHPAGVTNWFLENVVGSVQGYNSNTTQSMSKNHKIPREKVVHRPKFRQMPSQMPPMPRHFDDGKHEMIEGYNNAPSSHSFEDTDYYHDNEEYYDENDIHSDRIINSRISSMR